MAENMKILNKESTGEITEKKSRFIATLRPVSTVEEATAFVEEMKKQYWDARHNCSAFVIGDKSEMTRCSDDGEPSGTAGRPMLEVLLGEGVTNIAVVVTRYFGGVLLGTGGLVRAYQAAVKEGLLKAEIIEKKNGNIYEITCDYNSVGKLQYIMANKEIIPINMEYKADVTAKVALENDEAQTFEKEVTEGLNGNVKIAKKEAVSYAVMDGKTVLI